MTREVDLAEHYRDVVRALRQGNVVPVLGAGANLLPAHRWSIGLVWAVQGSNLRPWD